MTELANFFFKIISNFRYDITIGTSDKGDYVGDHEYPPYRHLLIVFGGLRGLESALENDDALKVDDPRLLFDYYLNTMPNQGSSTVRTEDALICSLIILQSKLKPKHRDTEFSWSSITKIHPTNTERRHCEAPNLDFTEYD